MVSSTGDGNPTLRQAHFLKPIINSIDEPVFELPSHCLSSSPPTFEPKNWPLKVTFNGLRYPLTNWKTWVEKMASLHENTWKKAGIKEAILNTTYKFQRSEDLILGLAEKWCPETKSFIFAWGEATITLEDLMILGFSVLGSPVFSPLETEEVKKIEEELNQVRKELMFSTDGKALHTRWLKKFMDTGSQVEHEAFLVLWLSRFVFPFSCEVISITNSVFPIAIHLARGTRIALAPAILASIYRDLSLLKQKIVCLTKLDRDSSSGLAITIRSEFQLVQIRAWERFLELRPTPNLIKIDEPRVARWHDTVKEVEDVRMVLDSAQETFDWRPYCKTLKNWSLPKFYGEKEMWVSVGPDSCEELQSFARCLRVSELVGLDCIEQYLPHRVAMQFGMDQDLPACVARANQSTSVAWSDYNKPIGHMNLYIPSRLYEADVTSRYSDWWKQSLLRLEAAREDVLDGLPLNMYFPSLKITTPNREKGMKRGDSFSNSKITRKRSEGTKKRNYNYIASFKITPKRFDGMKLVEKSPERSKWKEKDIDDPVSLGSPLKKAKNSAETLKVTNASAFLGLPSNSIIIKKETDDLSVPPGFAPKSKVLEGKDSTKEDNLSDGELLKCWKKHDDIGNRQVDDDKNLLRSETAMEDTEESKTSSPGHGMMKIQDGEGLGDGDEDSIEALLSRLERTAEELKACVARLSHKWSAYKLASK